MLGSTEFEAFVAAASLSRSAGDIDRIAQLRSPLFSQSL
jgi:hypothetical protein